MRSVRDALNWAKSIQRFAPISEHHVRAVNELWPVLGPLQIQDSLEVGAGEPPGIVTQMLRDHSVDAKSMDYQAGCDYQGDIHFLPFSDNHFDLVVARHVLEHVLIPYVVLQEMNRVARRYLLVVVPQVSRKTLDWPDHLYILNQDGWENIFRHLGLEVAYFAVGNHTEQHALDHNLWNDLEFRYLLKVNK